MLIYLKKRERNIKDSFPFPMILVSLIVGIVLNIIHIVFYHFSIDPTFIFVVVITFTLYMIIYKRDFNVNLILASRTFLFNKMREMYVIADHKHQIIEYSQNLLERFHTLELNLGDTVNEFYRKLKKQVIYYNDISEIYDIPFDETKTYLHIDDQAYQIDRFEASGELILLYDETLAIRMMNEIDIIRSHDQMSHVYNRNYFEENRLRLEKEYPYLGLILIDVDGLKLLNDYLGHHEGDQLIIRFANILLKLEKVYSDLLPIRFGGDEFVVIAKRADQKKLDDIIRRIEEGAMHPNPLLNISFSYGIAVRQPNEQIRSMLKRADGCLYEMKSKKSNYKEAFIKALKEASKDEDSAND
jgi:diguanylate cyclase (GGDEF)-like protein